MRNLFPFFVILFILIACTEPFDTGGPTALLDVIDGKISSLQGQSYIRIFQQVDDSTQIDIPNLSVVVISEQGDVVPFQYNRGIYVPENPNFAGLPGTQYKMEAANAEILIESAFDLMPPPMELKMMTIDTFVSILTPLNLIQKIDAVGTVALIPPQTVRKYARLRFEYEFIDFFSSEIDTVKFNRQFALYSCDNSTGCIDTTKLPVGLTTQQTWTFLNSNNPECLNRDGEVDLTDGCIPECCRFEDDWNAEFKVYSESMSLTTFTYWQQIQQLTNNNGLIFDTYPFPIEGNITCTGCENDVVGFFRAVSETFASENRIL